MDLKTPLYNLAQFPDVYEPSEDTFLLLDALEKDIPYLLKLKPQLAVEIGSGSGVVITAISQILKSTCAYFSTDINLQACACTKSTAINNGVTIECLNMDLLRCFKNHLFDLIIFNPPYVVTDLEEICGHGLSRAWAGGNKGRTVTDKILRDLPNLLSNKGVCYVVLLKDNDLAEVLKIMEGMNFQYHIVLERKIPGEYLYICKFFKNR